MQEFNLLKKFNWQEASKPTIKKYVANLKQTDIDAPVATTLFNDTDIAFSYDYIDTGVYGIRVSKPLFINCGMGCSSVQNAQINITNATFVDNLAVPTGYSVTAFPVSSDYIIMVTSNLEHEVDNILGYYAQNAIEITIYN